MSSEIAIKVENLSKCYQIFDNPRDRLKQFIIPRIKKLFRMQSKQYYREFWALKNVSFEISKGHTLGIIGRNGSGKSTLLQMICGTLNPSSGKVKINGRIATLLELGSGFNPEFTGRENVYLNASVMGLSKTEIDARYDDILSFADIGDFIDQPVKSYSSGMMVRLAFAVIAHVDADILVVDEALAVGDTFFTQKCMRFMRSFMQTGTIIFVSHDTSLVKSLCNYALLLDKGKLLHQGLPKKIAEIYLESFYESQQGKNEKTLSKKLESHNISLPARDQRLNFINSSNLRNDMKIFKFDTNSSSFGKGCARIVDVYLLDINDQPLSWIVGGEKVTLRIIVKLFQDIDSPVVGFYVKDRSGQTLFGDNTFITYNENPVYGEQGNLLQADFVFYMPILPPGDYSIATAIANGTQEEHVQHHWIHDALLFKSETSSVATGLVGIPMLEIKLQNFLNNESK